jgi:hypothetical protein
MGGWLKRGKGASVGDWLKVGKPDVKQDASGHTRGVRQGNASGAFGSQKGFLPDGRGTAERSTGINPAGAEPIDPSMPNLSPP